MIWPDFQESLATTRTGNHHRRVGKSARIRLSTDLLNGRYPQGDRLQLAKVAQDYDLDPSSARGILADLDALGMVTLAGPDSAIVRSPNPKEMHEAYEIRAALEEIGGRAAAHRLKGNTAKLQREQEIMRAAVRNRDLDAYAEHDVIFHRTILETSENEVLLFYAEYEPRSRVLAYVNAGQNPPIVIRCRHGQSRVFRLQPGGAPVGMFGDSEYNSVSFQLEDGDVLVACTDGIIEAENVQGELWGQQRLEGLFSCCPRQTAPQVLQQIVNEVSAFIGAGRQKDDITLLVVQMEAQAGFRT